MILFDPLSGLNMHATHGDFIALLDGLPATSGTENLEETLKTELQKATSQEARLHCSLFALCAFSTILEV